MGRRGLKRRPKFNSSEELPREIEKEGKFNEGKVIFEGEVKML